MFNVNDLKNGMTISFDNNIYLVIEFQHVKPGKGPAFVRTKLKNLRTKAVIDHTFNAGIKLEKAHISKEKTQFLYRQSQEFYFMNLESYDQISVSEMVLGDSAKYFKEGLEVNIIKYENEILDVELPEKIEMEVLETEPAVRGNTTQSAMKDATLETGLTVKVPLFIEAGEKIIISTKDGKYSGRS